MATPTEQEIEEMVALVRILIGDVESSIFYPLLTDEDIEALLRLENYNVLRAARRAAISVSFFLSQSYQKERTGDIEVVNNASAEYRKVLDKFIDDYSQNALPADLLPYAAGISKADYCAYNNDPDTLKSPLEQITPCLAWWTRVKKYNSCMPCGTLRVHK